MYLSSIYVECNYVDFLLQVIFILHYYTTLGGIVGTVKDFIDKVKQREGLKFDGQVAELLGIDRRILANWKSRESLPTSYQKWYCDRYDIKIKDFHKEIKITNTNIQKEDSIVDARYVIDLQREKIDNQQEEIKRLTAIVQKNKEVKNKPAFHFKTKANWDLETNTFSKYEVTGDTSMTGYSIDELKLTEPDTWLGMFHPDSLELIIANINQALKDSPEFQHTIWKHVYWKAKDGSYRMYNIEAYWDKEEGVVRSYYYWVNGDIEAKS